MKILVISEKDIAAARIAKNLSDGDADKHEVSGVNVYEWKEKKTEYSVIGLRGHIVSLDYPKEHTRWSLAKLNELVWAEPKKSVDKDAKKIADAIKKLAKKADQVIIATDFDREGELIGVEGLSIVLDVNPEVEVKRARFSSLTKEDVKKAFENLAPLDHNLAKSAEARQVIDLAWGAALTRFISLSSGQRGADFLSVGRVQSPTLALIVDKEKEIRAFIPKAYWEIHATLTKGGAEFAASHQEDRFWDEAAANAAYGRLAGARDALVKSIDRTQRTEKAPDPFNTTSFLRAATGLGMSAARAMSVAEDLYTNGFISYPRTDNTVYPPTENLREILEKLAQEKSAFKDDARILLEKPDLKPTAGKKTSTDHPPIHPVEVAMRAEVTGDHWKVYELVVRRFFATLSDSAVYENLNVGFDVQGEPFKSSGRLLVKPGFRAFYRYSQGKDVELPPLSEGERVPLVRTEVLAKTTQPPKRLSQGRLIQEMENLNLGTKATRADIIDKLYKRDYVRNNPPEPTEIGFAVTSALGKHAEMIAKPDMTAKLELEMDDIAEGKITFEEVVKDSRTILAQVLETLDKHRPEVAQEIRQAMQDKNTIGPCGKCGKGKLIMRRSKSGKRFVGCSTWPECDQTYPLPQYGKIVQGEGTCPVCSAPSIRVINKGKRPWTTCLTLGCKGMENAEQQAREARRAEREAEEASKAAAAAESEETPEEEEIEEGS
ncbi:MAG TPA: DNA topoisomerase I [Candidatus Thermoplasmatota archaeon]|nr:DNA topoisomerase I [Candidatus Thermoplasmatota archaeon]